MDNKASLELHIDKWRAYLRRRQAFRPVDIDELEDHLRSQIDSLRSAGLDPDEAFLVAVKRLGAVDALSREFAREHSARLWKQLVLLPDAAGLAAVAKRETLAVLALAFAAALSLKIPELFGRHIYGPHADNSFYARNFSLLVFPCLAAYFAWKRRLRTAGVLWLVLPFALGALAANLIPFKPGGHTESLAALHLPLALWLSVGFAYAAAQWRDHDRRMNFIRFSGEWAIYFTLIGLGGGVLMMFTQFIFHAIGLRVQWVLNAWLLPCGVAGAVLVAAWLVEAKQSVIENMAPVLTRIFTPLFAALLLVFLAVMLLSGRGIHIEREVLIGFDLLLALVLGLLLYAVSARDPQAPPDIFDALQLLLVLCALLVDAIALGAIASRISEFGFTPNKVAALGENLILLLNLAWSAVLYIRFLRSRTPFASLEHWQTACLPAYALWAWIVVLLFPFLFSFK